MAETTDTPIADLSYEEARAELTEVVHRLEAGGTTLEDSLALWERGEALADACQAWLDGARARLDAVRNGTAANGDVPGNGANGNDPNGTGTGTNGNGAGGGRGRAGSRDGG
jgi:exodeoxyribonuclease VII small subunit